MQDNDNNNDADEAGQALFDAIAERVRQRKPHLTPRAWVEETQLARDSEAFALDGFGLRVAEPRRLADAQLTHLADDYEALQARADAADAADMRTMGGMLGQSAPARREGESVDQMFVRLYGAPLESWL